MRRGAGVQVPSVGIPPRGGSPAPDLRCAASGVTNRDACLCNPLRRHPGQAQREPGPNPACRELEEAEPEHDACHKPGRHLLWKRVGPGSPLRCVRGDKGGEGEAPHTHRCHPGQAQREPGPNPACCELEEAVPEHDACHKPGRRLLWKRVGPGSPLRCVRGDKRGKGEVPTPTGVIPAKRSASRDPIRRAANWKKQCRSAAPATSQDGTCSGSEWAPDLRCAASGVTREGGRGAHPHRRHPGQAEREPGPNPACRELEEAVPEHGACHKPGRHLLWKRVGPGSPLRCVRGDKGGEGEAPTPTGVIPAKRSASRDPCRSVSARRACGFGVRFAHAQIWNPVRRPAPPNAGRPSGSSAARSARC